MQPSIDAQTNASQLPGGQMATTQTSRATRAMGLAFALSFGVFIVGFVGMSPIEAVHNAGHDYRHSMGFPCH